MSTPVNVFPNVLKISNHDSAPLYVQLGTTQGTATSTPNFLFSFESGGNVYAVQEDSTTQYQLQIHNLSTSGVTPLTLGAGIGVPEVAAYWGGNIIFGSGTNFYSLSPALTAQPVSFASPGVSFNFMAAGNSLWGVDASNNLWVYDVGAANWVKQTLSLPGTVTGCASTAAGIFMGFAIGSQYQLGILEEDGPSVNLVPGSFTQSLSYLCGIAQPLQIGGYSVTFWFGSSTNNISDEYEIYSMIYQTGNGEGASLSEVVPGPPQIGSRNQLNAICFAKANGLLYLTAVNTDGGGAQNYVLSVDPVLNAWIPLTASPNAITVLANSHFAAGLSTTNATFTITNSNPIDGTPPSSFQSILYYVNQPCTTSNGIEIGQSFFVGNPPGGTQLNPGWPYTQFNEGVHVRIEVDAKSGGWAVTELDIDPVTLAK